VDVNNLLIIIRSPNTQYRSDELWCMTNTFWNLWIVFINIRKSHRENVHNTHMV